MDQQNWHVEYPESLDLSLTFESLDFVQTFNNAIGVANHQFTITNLPEAAESFEGKEITFAIVSNGGDRQQWTHQITDFNIGYEREGGFPVFMRTMDLKVSLNEDDKNRAHRFEETFTDPIMKVVEDEGLTAKVWERQDILEEFKVLRQMNMTDYVWITQHVAPRMSGAYVLYTGEEKTINFHSLGFELGTYVAPEGSAGGVYETSNLIDTTTMGGGRLRAVGYSPAAKREIRIDPVGEEIIPSFGSAEPPYLGLRQTTTAFSTVEAVANFNETRNKRYAYNRYGVSVMLEGHIPGTGWLEPLILDLSETKYKDSSAQSGLMHSIVHTVERSQYRVMVRCIKNLKD